MPSHFMVLQAGRVCSRYSFCMIRLEVRSFIVLRAKREAYKMSLYLLSESEKPLSICPRRFPFQIYSATAICNVCNLH